MRFASRENLKLGHPELLGKWAASRRRSHGAISIWSGGDERLNVLSANDFAGEWPNDTATNCSLPDAELDGFVDAVARRISSSISQPRRRQEPRQ